MKKDMQMSFFDSSDFFFREWTRIRANFLNSFVLIRETRPEPVEGFAAEIPPGNQRYAISQAYPAY
jgi:hypothetical protein